MACEVASLQQVLSRCGIDLQYEPCRFLVALQPSEFLSENIAPGNVHFRRFLAPGGVIVGGIDIDGLLQVHHAQTGQLDDHHPG